MVEIAAEMADIRRAAENAAEMAEEIKIETEKNKETEDKNDKVMEKKIDEERKADNEDDTEQSFIFYNKKNEDKGKKNKLRRVVRNEKTSLWKIQQFG